MALLTTTPASRNHAKARHHNPKWRARNHQPPKHPDERKQYCHHDNRRDIKPIKLSDENQENEECSDDKNA